MALKSIFAALASAALLSACAGIPLTSLPRLQGLDPLAVDPAEIEVAVRLQDGLALEAGDVTLAYVLTNDLTGEELGGAFPLKPMDAPLTPFLQKQENKGGSVRRFRLTEAQAEEIREARATALAWGPESEGRRTLKFSAKATPCLTEEANPFRSIKFSLFLRETPAKEYFTLLKNKRIKVDEDTIKAARCGADTSES